MEMAAWEAMGKDLILELEVAREETVAVVSSEEMVAMVDKVGEEGSVLLEVMVVTEAMVAILSAVLPSPNPRTPPTRVSQGRKSSECFGQNCVSEFFPRQSVASQPPQPPQSNPKESLSGGFQQSLNRLKPSTRGWRPCHYPISRISYLAIYNDTLCWTSLSMNA